MIAIPAPDEVGLRHRVTEVLGPPGAGKSTALAALADVEPGARIVTDRRSLRDLPAMCMGCLALPPVVLPTPGLHRGTVKELEWMLRMETLARTEPARAHANRTMVFDQGPVYTLIRLRGALRGRATGERFARWWSERVAWSARILDVVVVLDAPDDALLDRIRTRPKPHALRDRPTGEARARLARFREVADEVLSELRAAGGVQALRLDTSGLSIAQTGRFIGDLVRRNAHPSA